MSTEILWIKGGALGDFILALPVLRALRLAYPADSLVALGPKRWLPLTNGYTNRTLDLEAPEWDGLYQGDRTFPGLANTRLAVLLRPDPEGLARKSLLASGVSQVLWLDPRPQPDRHQADHLCTVLEPLGLPVDPIPRLRLGRARPGSVAGSPGPAPREDRPVLLHPGSGGAQKRWPMKAFAALGQALRLEGQPVHVVLGPVELEQGEQRFWQREGFAVLAAPELPILVDALRQARGFLGNDSGVSHLAAACECPTLALFGPTDPRCWAPRGSWARVLQAPPREVTGERLLEGLSVEAVRQALTELLTEADLARAGSPGIRV